MHRGLNLASLKLSAADCVKTHPKSSIKQLSFRSSVPESESGLMSLAKHSRNGTSRQGYVRKVKRGWFEDLGALKRVWMMVIEKPLEKRIFAS